MYTRDVAGYKHKGMNAEEHTLKRCMDEVLRILHAYPNLYVHLHWLLTSACQLSQKLCLCRSRIFVPNRHIEHPAFHSVQRIREVWQHPTVPGCSFTEFVLPQETLTQPHRDKDRENSENNLNSLSRSYFNSQKSAECDSISPSSTRAGALAASVYPFSGWKKRQTSKAGAHHRLRANISKKKSTLQYITIPRHPATQVQKPSSAC